MKTKLISRLTLAGLLLSAAALSGTALADRPGDGDHATRIEQQHRVHHSLHKVAHHRHRHHHRHHHPR